MTEEFLTAPWRESCRQWKAPRHKLVAYALTRRALSVYARRSLPKGSLAHEPDYVFFTRGAPPQWRRRWGTKGLDLRGARILVQGAGTGWEALTWAEQRPASIVATDLFDFSESWQEIERYAHDQFGVRITFCQAPMERHDFLADASIDLCTSHNVLEHCRNLPSVLAESRRILRPGGILFADFDPMWFGPGGDHFSGRGLLSEIYNHLLLDEESYSAFFNKYTKKVEDFQDGGRYREIDLFSKLTTNHYIDCYHASLLLIDGLIVELSPVAFSFRQRHPDRYEALLQRTQGQCLPIDLSIKGNIVRLRKPL